MRRSYIRKVLMAIALVAFLNMGFTYLPASTVRPEVISCSAANKVFDNLRKVAPGEKPGHVVFTQVVLLRGENENPPVNTTAHGVAILRMTSDMKLYSKVIVSNLENDDGLLFSHIHKGAVGVNGPIQIFLCHNADEFGENMVQDLTEAQFNQVLNEPDLYVNAHSMHHGPGLVRGQLR